MHKFLLRRMHHGSRRRMKIHNQKLQTLITCDPNISKKWNAVFKLIRLYLLAGRRDGWAVRSLSGPMLDCSACALVLFSFIKHFFQALFADLQSSTFFSPLHFFAHCIDLDIGPVYTWLELVTCFTQCLQMVVNNNKPEKRDSLETFLWQSYDISGAAMLLKS